MPANEQHVRYARNISFVIAADVAVFLLGFIRFPLLTKLLGTSLYGIWTIVLITVSMATPFALLGLTSTMVRFLAADTDKAKISDDFFSIFLTVLGAGALLALLMLLGAGILASTAFNDPGSAHFLQLGSALVLTESLVTITLTYFRTFRQMGRYSLLTLLKAAIEIGLLAAFLLLGRGLEGVIIAVLIDNVLFILITLTIIIRQVGIRRPRFAHWKEYILYGLPLVPNVALGWIISASSRYIIGHYTDAGQVGIFAAAYNLGNLVTFFVTPMTTVLFPTVSKLYSEGQVEETKRYLKYSLKYVMMITMPVAFGLSALASQLLKVFSTEEFVSGAIVVPLITFGLAFFCFRQVTTFGLYLVNKTGWVGLLLVISAVLNVAFSFLLIPRLGIVGAGIGTLASYVILGILSVVVSFHYLKFDIELPLARKRAGNNTNLRNA